MRSRCVRNHFGFSVLSYSSFALDAAVNALVSCERGFHAAPTYSVVLACKLNMMTEAIERMRVAPLVPSLTDNLLEGIPVTRKPQRVQKLCGNHYFSIFEHNQRSWGVRGPCLFGLI